MTKAVEEKKETSRITDNRVVEESNNFLYLLAELAFLQLTVVAFKVTNSTLRIISDSLGNDEVKRNTAKRTMATAAMVGLTIFAVEKVVTSTETEDTYSSILSFFNIYRSFALR